ncbi:response regulator transcription factor [Georgenia sp. M64]|uniref:response regulator transcription factor n=1 Tax=Georgenia sp. M64 TaxID=3120520 RepID=UPI0030E1A4D1
MPLILVVDDDATVAEVVGAYLVRAGLEVERAADGLTAVEIATVRPPDVAILDLMLPGIDGLEVCRRLRRVRADLPVVMLTAREEEEDRILGLEVGADDYVTKPFSPRELVLRVQSLLRRATAPAAAERPGPALGAGGRFDAAGRLVDGDLVLDRAAHRAELAGRELVLTAREFDLLEWFLRHPGRAVGRDELMAEVWRWEYGDRSTVTVHVRRLREKVEDDPARPGRLVTVFGVGYRWDPEPAPADASA